MLFSVIRKCFKEYYSIIHSPHYDYIYITVLIDDIAYLYYINVY